MYDGAQLFGGAAADIITITRARGRAATETSRRTPTAADALTLTRTPPSQLISERPTHCGPNWACLPCALREI